MITLEFLRKLKYTDFIGIINQRNVPPGSYTTLNERTIFGEISSTSRILDIACTTGFSLRELSFLTDCEGLGIDISEYSVEAAKYNQYTYAPDLRIEYIHGDSFEINVPGRFSHIILGASLGFFDNPTAIINKCISYFGDTGIILVSPFYGNNRGTPSSETLERFKKNIGIYPTLKSYKKVMSLYKNFEIIYESKKRPELETDEEIQKYCNDTVERFCKRYTIEDSNIYKYVFNRLYKIKEVSNQIRPYHDYSVLVLRYRKGIYPDRLVELF